MFANTVFGFILNLLFGSRTETTTTAGAGVESPTKEITIAVYGTLRRGKKHDLGKNGGVFVKTSRLNGFSLATAAETVTIVPYNEGTECAQCDLFTISGQKWQEMVTLEKKGFTFLFVPITVKTVCGMNAKAFIAHVPGAQIIPDGVVPSHLSN